MKSSIPCDEMMSYHVAQILRQAENSDVVQYGWVGGDAFFGMCGAEACAKSPLHFIVKQNLNDFPKQVLHVVL